MEYASGGELFDYIVKNKQFTLIILNNQKSQRS